MREREHPVEFMVFEDEDHILLKRENKVTVQRAVVRFVDRYLGASVGSYGLRERCGWGRMTARLWNHRQHQP